MKEATNPQHPNSDYTGLLYRDHPVDIHSHVIVGLDDGAQTMEEAIEP